MGITPPGSCVWHSHGLAGGSRAVRAGHMLRAALPAARPGGPRRRQPALLAAAHAQPATCPDPPQLPARPAQQVLQ